MAEQRDGEPLDDVAPLRFGVEIPLGVSVYTTRLVHDVRATRAVRKSLRSSADVRSLFAPLMDDADREVFAVALLDAKHRVTGLNVVSIGSLTASIVHPREVFKPAVIACAAAIILGHNHPSGDPRPSPEDLEVTRRLKRAGDALGIRVLDHVILGEASLYSFADSGALEGG